MQSAHSGCCRCSPLPMLPMLMGGSGACCGALAPAGSPVPSGADRKVSAGAEVARFLELCGSWGVFGIW